MLSLLFLYLLLLKVSIRFAGSQFLFRLIYVYVVKRAGGGAWPKGALWVDPQERRGYCYQFKSRSVAKEHPSTNWINTKIIKNDLNALKIPVEVRDSGDVSGS